MTSNELAAHVRGRVDATSTGWNSQIAEERARLTREYMAEPYGNEVEGRSQFVSSDIADTVQWIMSDLIDVFMGGDKAVEFEPQGEEDEEAADQEADVLNHIFLNHCDGFHVLWSWFSDALNQFNGVVEIGWDIRREVTIEEYRDLAMEQVTLLMQDLQAQGIEVTPLGVSEKPDPMWQPPVDPMTGQPALDEMGQPPQPTMLYDIKFRAVAKNGGLMVEPIPPEEFFVTPSWTKVNVDHAPLSGRRRMATRSELIEMGYDRDQVETSGSISNLESSPERQARYTGDWQGATDFDDDRVEWTVAYIRVDFDGDGIDELRRVALIGNEIALWADGREDNEEVDYVPFEVITPYIVAHRHHGDCAARAVSDLQKLKTDFIRAMDDQIGMATFPPKEVAEGALNEYTIEDLLNLGPDSIIRTRQIGQMQFLPVQPATPMLIQAVEFVDNLREKRTGTSAYNQGMDRDSLNKTASGIQQIMSASQKKIMTIARTFAETGVKGLFRKMHRLQKRYGDRALAVKLRNTWVQTNPREWKDRTNLQVAVGLGSGTKPEKFAMLQQVLATQLQMLPLGIVTPQQLKHTADKMVALAGFKNPDLFFQAPQEQPDPGPSPEELLAAAEQDKADVQREKLIADDDFRRDQMESDNAFKNAELLGKYGIEVDMLTLQARINEPRYNQLRAERDADIASTAKTQAISKRLQAEQPQPGAANAA